VNSWWLRNLLAPAWALHERSDYLRVASRLERERRLSLDERQARQLRLLRDIVAHAGRHAPYYRDAFARIGFESGDLRTLDDLALLPILTKQAIRANADGLLTVPRNSSTLVARRTSGSTGVSLDFFLDDACTQWRRGETLYRDRWTGWDIGEWQAMVWGNPPPARAWRPRLRSALLERQFYLDTLRMDEPMMVQFAARVLQLRPSLLFGHAHSLYLLARFWERKGLPPYQFKGALSSAMMLHPHERDGIERVFRCRVFDRYGCEEVSLIASECEAHEGLHVNMDSLIVEVLSETGSPDGGGRVVVTDLRNRGMPFLRYEVGDRAVAAPRPCSCGRSYPLLQGVAGRVADYLRTPRGELVSGISLTENFATLIPGVEQVQIVQDRIDHLLIRAVPAPSFAPESRARMAALVSERFGTEMSHDLELVDRIPQERSGKYRFTICELDTP
jgi:phenylacetate-CoA ligase